MTRLYHVGIAAFLLAFALLTIPGTGQADRMRGGKQGAMMGMDMSQLSAEEQKVVQEIMQKQHGQVLDLHKKVFAKRAELNAVMAQEQFDAAKARALAKEISTMESDLMQRKLGMFIEMREKGVSYYGACMASGRMGPCMMGDGMGGGMGMGMSGRGMMDGGMMGGDMKQAPQQPPKQTPQQSPQQRQ